MLRGIVGRSSFLSKNRATERIIKRGLAVNKYGEWVNQPPVNVNEEYKAPGIPRIPRPNEPQEQKISRLLYYSRKRGILETDLLLSTWAQENLKSLTMDQLEEYDILLHENDWSIYYWLTNATQPPPHILKLSILEGLKEHTKNKGKKILSMPSLDSNGSSGDGDSTGNKP
jgi:succinate dehydrogenase assembly factor 2